MRSGGLGFFKDGSAYAERRFLAEVANAGAAGEVDAARIRAVLASQDLEERGFARPIPPDQRHLLPGVDSQGDAGEDVIGTKRLGDVGDVEQHGERVYCQGGKEGPGTLQ